MACEHQWGGDQSVKRSACRKCGEIRLVRYEDTDRALLYELVRVLNHVFECDGCRCRVPRCGEYEKMKALFSHVRQQVILGSLDKTTDAEIQKYGTVTFHFDGTWHDKL